MYNDRLSSSADWRIANCQTFLAHCMQPPDRLRQLKGKVRDAQRQTANANGLGSLDLEAQENRLLFGTAEPWPSPPSGEQVFGVVLFVGAVISDAPNDLFGVVASCKGSLRVGPIPVRIG